MKEYKRIEELKYKNIDVDYYDTINDIDCYYIMIEVEEGNTLIILDYSYEDDFILLNNFQILYHTILFDFQYDIIKVSM